MIPKIQSHTVTTICVTGNEEFTAIAKYSYYPEAQGELELVVGDEVIVLEELKDGWWRGRVGQNEGVFPSNMVDELSPVLTTPTDKVEQLSSKSISVYCAFVVKTECYVVAASFLFSFALAKWIVHY